MYQKILVLLDGSERAEVVLPHVKSLAAQNDSTVVLLQVLEPGVIDTSPFDASPGVKLEKAQKRMVEATEYLRGWEQKFKAESIDAKHRVERGPVVATVLEVADDDDVDLIAMASHGRTGLSRVCYGSTAAGLLQGLNRPLLLIRAN